MTSIGIGFDDGTGLAIVAVRPAGAPNHAEEQVAAALTCAGETEPLRVERALLSTEYGEDGRPRRASVELHFADQDEEPPWRVGGEQISCESIDPGEGELTIALFRWSLDGVPGLGHYSILTPAP